MPVEVRDQPSLLLLSLCWLCKDSISHWPKATLQVLRILLGSLPQYGDKCTVPHLALSMCAGYWIQSNYLLSSFVFLMPHFSSISWIYGHEIYRLFICPCLDHHQMPIDYRCQVWFWDSYSSSILNMMQYSVWYYKFICILKSKSMCPLTSHFFVKIVLGILSLWYFYMKCRTSLSI